MTTAGEHERVSHPVRRSLAVEWQAAAGRARLKKEGGKEKKEGGKEKKVVLRSAR